MTHHQPVPPRVVRTAADALRLFRPGFGAAAGGWQVAHLDGNGHVLAIERHRPADPAGGMLLPVRALLERSLLLDGRALVLARDDRSGDARPSHEEMLATRALVRAARPLDIEVTDHLVFAGRSCASFRQMGLL